MLSPKSPAKALFLALACLFCAWLPARGQEKLPSVAIMEPTVVGGGDVKGMDRTIVRQTLAEYLTNSGKLRVLDRASIDQMAKEHNFQRQGGLVDSGDVREMGKLLGADFVCTLELSRDGNAFGANVALIDIVSAATPFSSYEMTPSYSAGAVRGLAQTIGRKILETDLRLGAAAQQGAGLRSVAVMEPTVAAGAPTVFPVSEADKLSARGTLSEYLTRSGKLRVLDRNRIDQLAKEHDFQRSRGLVDQSKVKEMGKLMGADFVLTLELIRDDDVFGMSVAMIDIVTGETPFSFFEMTPDYSAAEVRKLAEAMGKKILSLRDDQLGAEAQQGARPPSVAVMEPTVGDGTSAETPVATVDKFAVRGTLSEFLTLSGKLRVLDRDRIDQIAKEQAFQRQEGLVDQTRIKEMGKMMGADFICTLELIREGPVFGVNVALIDVESAETPFSSFEMTERYSAMEVKRLAGGIGKKILSLKQSQLVRDEAERARLEAAERARLEAERKAREDAAAAARREAEEKAAFEASSTALKPKIESLAKNFDGKWQSTLKHKTLVRHFKSSVQRVVDTGAPWHSLWVQLDNGELEAFSRYVRIGSGGASYNRVTATVDGREISLPLSPELKSASAADLTIEQAPITNVEWLRVIANGSSVTIKQGGLEYRLDAQIHNAIKQTIEMYDLLQRMKRALAYEKSRKR